MKNETASENSMSRPQSQKLRPGNGSCLGASSLGDSGHSSSSVGSGIASVATQAAVRAKDALLMLRHRLLLLAHGDHLRLATGFFVAGHLGLL